MDSTFQKSKYYVWIQNYFFLSSLKYAPVEKLKIDELWISLLLKNHAKKITLAFLDMIVGKTTRAIN